MTNTFLGCIEPLVLNPAKSHFFMPKMEMLGLQADGKGVRPGNEKLRTFSEYPTPTCERELDQFEYMTTYLRKFNPGGSFPDHAQGRGQGAGTGSTEAGI